MDFIKTKSSYVERKKHSETKDGTIFERDITTLGGLNLFSSTQTPIYTSGNLIISVDNTIPTQRKIEKNSWVSNGDSNVWTLDTISQLGDVESDSSSNETNITLKKDFYRLQDFSYYGSLSKMIESSLNNIVNTFPGELYVPFNPDNKTEGYLVKFNTYDYETNEYGEGILGQVDYSGNTIMNLFDETNVNESYYFISNPFNINFHTKSSSVTENMEKYFFYENNKNNYQIIVERTEVKVKQPTITSGVVVNYTTSIYDVEDLNVIYKTPESLQNAYSEIDKYHVICPGTCLCQVIFEDKDGKEIFEFKAFLGDNNKVHYLTSDKYIETHIRPKEDVYNKFIDNLSIFETYLLTKKESTKSNMTNYISTFEIIQDDNNGGMIKTLEDFIIPIDKGGYNIDISSVSFQKTVDKLSKIAFYYDENFCDNIYRSMTHESIKNFDWTHNREYEEGDAEDLIAGGNKISNVLHLFGREFDEIKNYIDAIKNINVLSYDSKNNLPDYFLSDVADIKGWDVRPIYPYMLEEYFIDNNNNKRHPDNYDVSGNTIEYDGTKYKLNRVFSTFNTTSTIQPYKLKSKLANGVFVYCDCDGKIKEELNTKPKRDYLFTSCLSFGKIGSFMNNQEYSLKDVNNEFSKRLCLNTPSIFKTKGTIEGIEEILAMFGMKSRKWVDSLSNSIRKKYTVQQNKLIKEDYYIPDFDIKEYTTFTNGLFDKYNEDKEVTWINWYNSTKLMPYEYNGKYEGLPVKQIKIYNSGTTQITEEEYLILSEEDKKNYTYIGSEIYPFFGNKIDGNPYYQMNGGWLEKSDFTFDKDNNILHEGNENEDIIKRKLFTETYSNVRWVENITDVKDLIPSEMKDGDIMYVENFNKDYMIVDGFDIYEIKSEIINDIEYKYIDYTIKPNRTTIGDITFVDALYFSNPAFENNIQTVSLKSLDNEIDAKVYLFDKDGWETLKKNANHVTGSTIDSGFTFSMSDGFNELYDRHISYFMNISLDNTKTDYKFVNIDEINYDRTEEVYDTLKKYTNYFILHIGENCKYYDMEYGWEQLSIDDTRYLKINSIIDKFKGNNPHIGHNKYDSGYEYIDYFNFIFKYVLENNLINEDCFLNGTYQQHLEIMEQIGFGNLGHYSTNNYNSSRIDYYQYDDSKVHSFCNLIKNDKNSSTVDNPSEIYFRNVTGNIGDDIYKQKYGADYHLKQISRLDNTISNDISGNADTYGYNVKEINPISGISSAEIITNVPTNDITYQIMNTKRVDIIFYMHTQKNKKYSVEGLKEKKYINDVILPYLEQMLPTNIICKIVYSYT